MFPLDNQQMIFFKLLNLHAILKDVLLQTFLMFKHTKVEGIL